MEPQPIPNPKCSAKVMKLLIRPATNPRCYKAVIFMRRHIAAAKAAAPLPRCRRNRLSCAVKRP
jgi:hypothetical protein